MLAVLVNHSNDSEAISSYQGWIVKGWMRQMNQEEDVVLGLTDEAFVQWLNIDMRNVRVDQDGKMHYGKMHEKGANAREDADANEDVDASERDEKWVGTLDVNVAY